MIQVVNIKHYKGNDAIYIGRRMPGRDSSPLGNPFRLRFECDRKKILAKYEYWLREQLKSDTPQRREIERLADYADELVLACWCKQPDREVACHGDVVKKVIEERLAAKRAAALIQGVFVGDDGDVRGILLSGGENERTS